jgi:hypothetical protein
MGFTPKDVLQVAPKGKEIIYDALPYPGIGNLEFRMGLLWRQLELADYRKIHGHCNFPRSNSENSKLSKWVAKQKWNYRLHREGKKSCMPTYRIQALESLGFE